MKISLVFRFFSFCQIQNLREKKKKKIVFQNSFNEFKAGKIVKIYLRILHQSCSPRILRVKLGLAVRVLVLYL